jgi:hypothetical protein
MAKKKLSPADRKEIADSTGPSKHAPLRKPHPKVGGKSKKKNSLSKVYGF